jgi:cysteine-rich repeat protein
LHNFTRASAALLFLFSASPAFGLSADDADDICHPDADPCVISEPVHMDQRTTLDFGLREVQISAEGGLHFGAHGGVVLCGGFESAEGTWIDASGSVYGLLDGGPVAIRARRGCGLEPEHPCLKNSDCALGTCTTRLCSARGSRTCMEDSDCQVGPCTSFNRCQGLGISCSTNADCDFGACPADRYCSTFQGGRTRCETDGDCQLGLCSDGTAPITLDGTFDGRGLYGSQVDLLAADNIEMRGALNLTSRSKEGAGGELAAKSTFGDVNLRNRLRSNGGSSGGYHQIYAGQDVLLAARIDMDGGDYDGGTLDVYAGGNVTVEESISANARRSSGFGGVVLIGADGDVVLRPGPQTRRMRIRTNGHAGQFDEGGAGGDQDYYSRDGSVYVHQDVLLQSNGGAPSGGGGITMFDAGEQVQFDGQLVAHGRGADGVGGETVFFSSDSIALGSSSLVDLSSAYGEGRFELEASGRVVLAGTVLASTPPGARDNDIDVRAGDLEVSGELGVGGGMITEIDLRACRIDLLSSASLRNDSVGGINELWARESIRLHDGSELLAKKGTNRLIYRTDDKPPVVDGFVDTPGVLVLNPALVGCPVCGNTEIDMGETCDDGNVVAGDGCSPACLME